MPYIKFTKMPDSIGVGRTARNVTFKADTGGDWVAEVDEAFPGETEIDEATFTALASENQAHNAALPPPEENVPEPPVTLVDILLADKTLSVETKAAIANMGRA